MTENISKVLQDLRQDHRNMALMLNLLERESNQIYAGDPADFDLMYDIMHYMTVYPDAVHHPKEDKIYGELKSHRPDLSSGFARITVDHRNIAEQSMKLRNDIELVTAGAMMKRKSVVADALRYVNNLRSHMQWEELDLFNRVEEMIAAGHDVIDETSISHAPDPVFGSEVEQEFGKLLESIKLAQADDS